MGCCRGYATLYTGVTGHTNVQAAFRGVVTCALCSHSKDKLVNYFADRIFDGFDELDRMPHCNTCRAQYHLCAGGELPESSFLRAVTLIIRGAPIEQVQVHFFELCLTDVMNAAVAVLSAC